MSTLLVLNGPNLNLLGTREPTLYGSLTLDGIREHCETAARRLGHDLVFFQSNAEYRLIERIHEAAGDGTRFIIINPAAFTHTSIGLADAVAAIDVPVVEVHISQVEARESYRQKSYVSKYVKGRISGFGLDGYRMAIDQLLRS